MGQRGGSGPLPVTPPTFTILGVARQAGEGLQTGERTLAQTRGAVAEGLTLPVSDHLFEQLMAPPLAAANASPAQDDERPPMCPKCNKRLVILATQSARDEQGSPIRQQLWGCPKGHATAIRRAGVFTPVELLTELVG